MKKFLEANSQKRFIETLLILISMFSAGLVGFCLSFLLIDPLGDLLGVRGFGLIGLVYWSILFGIICSLMFSSIIWGYYLGKGKIKTAVIIISVVLFAGLLMFSQIFIK